MICPKIGELIPHLTSQFIAFTISSERERFIPHLIAAANNNVQFVTMFRKGSKDLQHAARKEHDFLETTDGFIVGGEMFFNEFQVNEEAS